MFSGHTKAELIEVLYAQTEAATAAEIALATERRITVERIRRRAVLASDDYSDDEGQYAEISMHDLMKIIDEVASDD